jgi:sensor histidine kinase YesM
MTHNKTIKIILRQLLDILIAAVFSFFVTWAFAGNRMFTSWERIFPNLMFGFLICISLWKGNQYLGWLVGRRFSWMKQPKSALIASLIGSVIYAAIAIWLIHYIYMELLLGIGFLENMGRFMPQMIIILAISTVITISFYLAYFFKWWRLSVISEEKLKQEAIQLRYDALKNQINPHFLFNSLSVLSSLVETDPKKATAFIRKFSDIYRYVLDQRDKELVELSVELDFIRSYVDLHLVRHEGNLDVEYNIDDKTGYIIPLSLQIVIENCLKHNIVSSDNMLRIKIERSGNYLTVTNNLQRRKAVEQSNGLGLETLKNRYAYLSGQPVVVEETEKVFSVKIPVIRVV